MYFTPKLNPVPQESGPGGQATLNIVGSIHTQFIISIGRSIARFNDRCYLLEGLSRRRYFTQVMTGEMSFVANSCTGSCERLDDQVSLSTKIQVIRVRVNF